MVAELANQLNQFVLLDVFPIQLVQPISRVSIVCVEIHVIVDGMLNAVLKNINQFVHANKVMMEIPK